MIDLDPDGMNVVGLHWGCGPVVAPGWMNSDRDRHGQEHCGDLLAGLPWRDRTFRCVVTHHALQMLDRADIIPALLELRRVVKVGGWIRVSVPDLERALAAYIAEREYLALPAPTFLRRLFPGEAAGAALNAYLTHYDQRTYWTRDYLAEVLGASGWQIAGRCKSGETLSGVERICELDSRPDESLILEAVRK